MALAHSSNYIASCFIQYWNSFRETAESFHCGKKPHLGPNSSLWWFSLLIICCKPTKYNVTQEIRSFFTGKLRFNIYNKGVDYGVWWTGQETPFPLFSSTTQKEETSLLGSPETFLGFPKSLNPIPATSGVQHVLELMVESAGFLTPSLSPKDLKSTHSPARVLSAWIHHIRRFQERFFRRHQEISVRLTRWLAQPRRADFKHWCLRLDRFSYSQNKNPPILLTADHKHGKVNTLSMYALYWWPSS